MDIKVKRSDVVLVSMPFGTINVPSLALGLLAAILKKEKINVEQLHLTLDMADFCGFDLYEKISDQPGISFFVGEWLFSNDLFEKSDIDTQKYLEEILHVTDLGFRDLRSLDQVLVNSFLALNKRIPEFLDFCVDKILSRKPKIIGFTSVFQQHAASLAIAKRIKSKDSSIKIIMGGPNCEDVQGIETMKQFGFLDAVVSGEADLILPVLIKNLLENKDVSNLAGVITKSNIMHGPKIVQNNNLDELPYPCFDDFYTQFGASTIKQKTRPELPFESSRGCWWGAKHHCVFCGLNKETMGYRSKSPERALDELLYLVDKYPASRIFTADNILDLNYLKSFVPELAKRNLGLDIYYETKSNLKKHHIEMLSKAGISSLQPGLESLSDNVLSLMRKGAKGAQQLKFLQWCELFAVECCWNMLWGIPGESADDYRELESLLPYLTHLPPPGWGGPVSLLRFSPMQEYPEKFGIDEISPEPAYRHVYPFDDEVLTNMAYYFSYKYKDQPKANTYTKGLTRQISKWREEYRTSILFYEEIESLVYVYDLREVTESTFHCLDGLGRDIFLETIDGKSHKNLVKKFTDIGFSDEVVINVIKKLQSYGLLLNMSGIYINLSLNLPEYIDGGRVNEPFLRSQKKLLVQNIKNIVHVESNQNVENRKSSIINAINL